MGMILRCVVMLTWLVLTCVLVLQRTATAAVSFESVYPNHGPSAGRTYITITGEDLMLREEGTDALEFNDMDVKFCEIVRSRTTNRTIVCETLPFDTVHSNNSRITLDTPHTVQIRGLVVDNDAYTIDWQQYKYMYRPDPTITELEPYETIASAGTHITVHGSNLDASSQPLMVQALLQSNTDDPDSNSTTAAGDAQGVTQSVCEVVSSTMLLCTIQELAPSGTQAPSVDTGVMIGYIFDGFTLYSDIAAQLPGLADAVPVRPDPVVQSIGRYDLHVWWPHKPHQIVVQGSGLQMSSVLLHAQYQLYIGDLQLSSDQFTVSDDAVTFTPPGDEPKQDVKNGGSSRVIKLQLGYLSLPLGNIHYRTSILQCVWCVGVLFSSVAVVVFILCAVCCCVCHKKCRKPKDYSVRSPPSVPSTTDRPPLEKNLSPQRQGPLQCYLQPLDTPTASSTDPTTPTTPRYDNQSSRYLHSQDDYEKPKDEQKQNRYKKPASVPGTHYYNDSAAAQNEYTYLD